MTAADEPRVYRVGVISDTHRRLPDAAVSAFEGVDAIVHAGDVEGGDELDVLRTIAPVTAVRGNTDSYGEAAHLPLVAVVTVGGVRFVAAHKKRDLPGGDDPRTAGARVIVTGHTHRVHVDDSGGVLHLNPGSAGWPRDGHPATVAVVEVRDGDLSVRIVEL